MPRPGPAVPETAVVRDASRWLLLSVHRLHERAMVRQQLQVLVRSDTHRCREGVQPRVPEVGEQAHLDLIPSLHCALCHLCITRYCTAPSQSRTMRYARRSGVWHSQTLEKKHVYRVFHHAVVTQHRRDDTFAGFRPQNFHYTRGRVSVRPKKPSRVKQERERWTQRLGSLTGLRILDISQSRLGESSRSDAHTSLWVIPHAPHRSHRT